MFLQPYWALSNVLYMLLALSPPLWALRYAMYAVAVGPCATHALSGRSKWTLSHAVQKLCILPLLNKTSLSWKYLS